MAYIIFVNPQMMAASGMDLGASFVGTCLAAAIACFAMGFYSNWPVGLAPGMGLNAFLPYTVVGEMGYSWEVALGAVFLAGVLFVIISITPLRQWMLNSIPMNLRIAMGAGVGLFVGFIGLKTGGIIIQNDATFLSLGNFANSETLLAALGFLIISILAIRKVTGAIIIGVLSVTLIGLIFGLVQFNGIVSAPPKLSPILLKLDIMGALDIAMISVIISFLFVNLFDTAGTLLGVASRASLIEDSGKIINLDKAPKQIVAQVLLDHFLVALLLLVMWKAQLVLKQEEGQVLQLLQLVIFFIVAIFFSPLASMVPAYATAGALIYVAILMLGGMEKLDWSDNTELLPALIMIIMIPLTFSIANGIALGFIAYVALKVSSGKINDVSSGAWFLALIFLAKFALLLKVN